MACSKKQDVLVVEPIKTEIVQAKGEVLGKQISLSGNELHRSFTSFIVDVPKGTQVDIGTPPDYIAPCFSLGNKETVIQFFAPWIKRADYTWTNIIDSFSGKKPIGTKNMDAFESLDIDRQNYVLAYVSPQYTYDDGGLKYIVSKGEQKNSSVEFLSCKEISPAMVDRNSDYRVLQVKFRINCQLFHEQTYIGEVKNLEITANYVFEHKYQP